MPLKPYKPSDLHILAADDDVYWREHLERLLTQTGLTSATIVNDGQDIISRLANGQRPHLIITDNQMYNVWGYKVLDYLKQHQPYLPAIMSSSGSLIAPGITAKNFPQHYPNARFILKSKLTAPTLTAAITNLLPAVDFNTR